MISLHSRATSVASVTQFGSVTVACGVTIVHDVNSW